MSVTVKRLAETQYVPASTTTLYTAPALTKTIIDKFTLCNISGGAVTVSVYIVPSGGTASDSNMVIKALSVAASGTEDVSKLQNQILNAAGFIAVIASAATSVTVGISGREVT